MISLSLKEVGLLQHGPTISLEIERGRTLCVVGPTSSGKSKLLKMIAGQVAPDRGQIDSSKQVAVPEPCNRKLRPQDLSHRKGENQAAQATEVLSSLGLWDVRQRTIAELSPSQITACDLVAIFMGKSSLVVLDGHLDLLDPWIRAQTLGLMRDRASHGTIFVVSTDDLELASQFDSLIVLNEYQPAYAGTVFDLISHRGQRKLTIESERSVGVRALVDPLLVEVTKTPTGYKLQPGPGQDHTAKLLRDGYGDVKFVISDERTLPEIIMNLTS